MTTTHRGMPFTLALTTALSFASVQATVAAGPVTITQAKATNGNITPGDAPGFPVTISKPGSYVLTGNLTLPNGGTTAVEITASHVTLDLHTRARPS